MKKFLQYILIIAIIGIFVPLFGIHAEQTTPPTNMGTGYTLLAPLPCPPDGADCEGGQFKTFKFNSSALSGYLNIMIKIIIGIAGVLAVLMIVIGGIEYMGSELISSKEAGKDRIQNALLGLLIALGAWALLNTINGNLLNSDVKIENITVFIEGFPISGAQTKDGKPGTPVSFKKEACPAAQAAQAITGVDRALVLAIFAQETASGANTGGCKPANANMTQADLVALGKIVGDSNVATTNVSCAFGGGHGGAIGLMQFLPSTWLETAGGNKDPWKTDDALMAAAVYLKNKGAILDPRDAACKYYSGVSCQPGRNPPNEFYGDQVMTKFTNIKQQIENGGCIMT